MIFAKKNITVRAYDFGYGFQSLVYDNVISVDNVDLYTLMTRIQGIQILRLGHTNYQVGGIKYDAELGKFKTLGGETFRVVYMINPERV